MLATGAFNSVTNAAAASAHVELYTVTDVTEVSREEFALSAKVTRLGLEGASMTSFAKQVRGTSIFAQSEPLTFAEYPVSTPLSGSSLPVNVAAEGLQAGRRVLVRGTRVRDRADVGTRGDGRAGPGGRGRRWTPFADGDRSPADVSPREK